ncbi:serine hydrolase [Flammeovirga yaeyamensis]|uniref:Serine hydrolase n=1 Tax=Flammeovirga yaeyamensis TaxID=367791 RepID=A0AAX1NE72_9BACT|nr:serine hydrolase [Flammeovirga yaeyamensis]MBB3697144.1 CubicO group peptidase (beta-lactamase class C family) [Flammeovirga yaeyamensis]NMF33805.1 serine hydrolase [Flammeovirga yaeyamensis]QWG04931.1 serine hydrolase [Flammeovirga yaeyamensis]
MNKKYYYSLLLLLCHFQLFGQTYKKEVKKIDAYFSQIIQDWEVPSMSVGIIKDGQLIFSKGYGTKEIGKEETPDKETLYAIASISKGFTATMISQLVDEGKLNWEDKVVDHLPYFAVYDPMITQLITVKDILSHRVGLGTFSGDIMWYQSDYTSEEIIKRIKYVPQSFELRDGFGYSNLMFITAGQLIKEVTGKTWGENVQERILDPLGMDRTIYSLKNLDKKGNYATPHRLENNTKNIPIEWTNWEEIAATGGLISSVEDLAKWLDFNMKNGIMNGDTLISASSRNQLWKIQNPYTSDLTKSHMETHFSGYGLGWGVKDYHGNLRVSHSGGYDGMITMVNMIPDQQLGVIVLTNGLKSPISAASNYAIDVMLGMKEVKDYSKLYLESSNKRFVKDDRVEKMRESKVEGTKPTLNLKNFEGVYHSKLNGDIKVELVNGQLSLTFEHQSFLNADLAHWHYNTFELKWKNTSPWFTLGTVNFTTDNQNNVTGITFEVPNHDFYFEEIRAKKVK